jgi:hypothetical protein
MFGRLVLQSVGQSASMRFVDPRLRLFQYDHATDDAQHQHAPTDHEDSVVRLHQQGRRLLRGPAQQMFVRLLLLQRRSRRSFGMPVVRNGSQRTFGLGRLLQAMQLANGDLRLYGDHADPTSAVDVVHAGAHVPPGRFRLFGQGRRQLSRTRQQLLVLLHFVHERNRLATPLSEQSILRSGYSSMQSSLLHRGLRWSTSTHRSQLVDDQATTTGLSVRLHETLGRLLRVGRLRVHLLVVYRRNDGKIRLPYASIARIGLRSGDQRLRLPFRRAQMRRRTSHARSEHHPRSDHAGHLRLFAQVRRRLRGSGRQMQPTVHYLLQRVHVR